jgi:hypothetical protein
MKKLLLLLVILLGSVSMAAADTIYLRGGSTLRGNVLGFINGRFVIQLTSNATIPVNPSNNRNQTSTSTTGSTRVVSAGEVIFLRPRDIERVEIEGRSLDDARYQTRTIDVGLDSNWIDSGVDIRRGERVRVDATGTIYAGRTRITPAGLSTSDPNSPLPRAAEGELIAVLGSDYNSPILEIGNSREFVADRDGRIYFTANRANYNDARGVFRVQVKKEIDLAGMARTADDSTRNDNYDPFYSGDTATTSAPIRSRERGGYNNPINSGRGNRTSEKVVDVPGAQQRGVDTGIELRSGDQVVVTATGNVTAGRRAGVVSADGGRQGAAGVFGASTYPVPTAGVGALIGYIVSSNGQASQAFLIGSQSTFTTPVDGRLYLAVNDDNYSDNSGSFSVRIVYPSFR